MLISPFVGGESEAYFCSFFTLGARWGKSLTPRHGRFNPRNDLVPILYQAVFGPCACPDVWENLPHQKSISEPCLKHLYAVIYFHFIYFTKEYYWFPIKHLYFLSIYLPNQLVALTLTKRFPHVDVLCYNYSMRSVNHK